jgi:sugar/nucleoside kinase (ribokinase family)
MLTEQGLRALNPGERDWILLSGYGLFKNTSARLLAPWVGELGKGPVFVFDPGPVVADIPPEILDRVLSRADWVTANQKESEILTGRFDPGGAAEVLARGRRGAIVRVGKDGCWLATGGGADFVAGFPVDTVDTNGAGDTHAGAFIAACGLGHDVQGATVLANAAAALSTTRHGPATAPSLGETIAFLASRDIRLQVSKNVAQMDVA